jgi:uncharacterized protein (DUF2267 family)
MEHDEFIGQVQSRARLASRGDAERATRATLETLGERIDDGAASNLAAQLPHEIGEHLHRTASGTGEQFGYTDFLDRVEKREGVDRPDAVYHARVVLEVVQDATTGNLIGKTRQQLPAEFDALFESGSEGQLRTS